MKYTEEAKRDQTGGFQELGEGQWEMGGIAYMIYSWADKNIGI